MKRMMPIDIVLILSLITTAQAAQFRGSAAPDGSKVIGKSMKSIQVHNGFAEKEKKDISEAKAPGLASTATEQSIQNPQAPLGKECPQPRPKALFCYALVRTPPEPTAALLAKQLSVACDGWALFGDTADPANNVTKAFSKEDAKKGYPHQLREMVTTGVWKHLIESGATDEYEYFLRVDPDSFVRPSTLRKTFKSLSTNCSRSHMVISIWNDDVDGYFGAVQADTALRMKSLGWPRECDVVLSGSDNSDASMLDPNECLREIDGHFERLEDSLGHYLVTSDADKKIIEDQDQDQDQDPDDDGTDQEDPCGDMASLLLGRASQKIKGPLCQCVLPREHQPHCISEDFVTVHHVKEADTYSQLVKAFP